MVINGCENGIFLTCCFFQIKEPTSCRLYLLINSEKVFVAFGTIHPELTLDHHNNLVADNVKVSVDEFEPAYKEASVPVPSQFIKKLGQALGTFTQWPTNLVSLVTSPEVNEPARKEPNEKRATSKEPKGKEVSVESQRETKGSNTKANKQFLPKFSSQKLGVQCNCMKTMVSKLKEGEDVKLQASKRAFNFDNDRELIIAVEDINQLLSGAWLNISILQVLILALYESWDEFDHSTNALGFMCPEMISETMLYSDINRVLLYMSQSMATLSSKSFILCPYFEKRHWILLVICLAKSQVYIFDSM
ncbi:uncharacterized protein [Spinacia oleracea]|uniref:Ubiquitin-like protease family profile domain-containing protein n=1 Tax=Spinacia oleracea TaxID=3562 RepID=A0ABM3QYY0_SPIOL|nr:uncharacterized protein LOC130463460 [Spinacia oleracea]